MTGLSAQNPYLFFCSSKEAHFSSLPYSLHHVALAHNTFLSTFTSVTTFEKGIVGP